MKLTKSEVQKICDLYDLGKVKKLKLITSGWVNFNHDVKTDKGDFIIRIIGGRIFDDWKKKKIKLEFELFDYLKKKNFPYEIPLPIKNKSGKKLTMFNKRCLWVYKKIKGESKYKYCEDVFIEVVRAMAIYHKYVKGFKGKKVSSFDDYSWFFDKFDKLKKVEPKSKTDKLMLRNVGFFESLLKKVSKMGFGKKIVIHEDFHMENLLYKNRRAVAIIDFDNVDIAPRMNDLAIFVGGNCIVDHKLSKKRYNVLLNEYRKIMPISKKEEKMIIPLTIRHNAILFWWFYEGMEKMLHRRHSSIEGVTKTTKNLVRYWR